MVFHGYCSRQHRAVEVVSLARLPIFNGCLQTEVNRLKAAVTRRTTRPRYWWSILLSTFSMALLLNRSSTAIVLTRAWDSRQCSCTGSATVQMEKGTVALPVQEHCLLAFSVSSQPFHRSNFVSHSIHVCSGAKQRH